MNQEASVSATRVAIVEDEPLFRQLLRTQLSTDPEIEVIGEASTGEEAVALARDLKPEVMLMDIELGEGITGIEAGYAIKAERPSIGIVLLSNHRAKQFIVTSGGWSYLIKRNVRDVATVARAIKGAAWGMLVIDPQLTQALRPKADAPLARLESRNS
jgi:DNA-binding NarL/FixJ family response regulator